MKSIKIRNNDDWTPLKLVHQHDKIFEFGTDDINTADGLRLNTSSLQQNSIDFVSDNYSNILLTKQLQLNSLFNFKNSISKYPEYFTSSLICNAYPTNTNISAYISIVEEYTKKPTRDFVLGESTPTSSWIWSQNINSNSIYFNITLLNENELTVSHNDNTDIVYMSTDFTTDPYRIIFKTCDLNIPTDTEKFNYYINKDTGFLILYKSINDKVYYVLPDVFTGQLIFEIDENIPGAPLPLTTVLKFQPYVKNSQTLSIPNNWVSYKTGDNQNNLDINTTKSIFNVTNNYLIDSQFYNIDKSGEIKVNITQLKNQITTFGDINRENPFPNLNQCDHRSYDKIFFDDSNELFLGYCSYEYEITIEPDNITYFNTPQDMYPYNKININDSGLVRRGAVGGDSPLTSDKIFKKTSGYKYDSPHGTTIDEDTGVWLCSWLMSNNAPEWDSYTNYTENLIVNYDDKVYQCISPNINKRPNLNSSIWRETDMPPPVWVDRYYNPKQYTVLEALSIDGQYSTYTSKFDSIVDRLGTENNYIFDKKSDVVFEPGTLYAYYRFGPNQIKTSIKGLEPTLIHTGVDPALLHTGATFNNIDSSFISFTGDQYIQTSTPANIVNSDYTICFELGLDDWSKPFGSQIVGNYTNEGLGIFNKIETTPYIILHSSDNVYVYNTQLDEVLSIQEDNVTAVTKHEGNENITMYKGLSAVEYDLKGMLVENFKTSNYISYRNEKEEVYITSLTPGLPAGVVRLYSDITAGRTIIEMVDLWNVSNPEFQILLTGEGSTGDNVWIPSEDIVITADDIDDTPAGFVVDADIDNEYRYVLDNFDQIYRYDINNENIDRLNQPFPVEIIGAGSTQLSNGVVIDLPSSNKKFIQTANDGQLQFIIDCDHYTLDMYNQPWFAKGDFIYKFSLSEQQGINASWSGFLPVVSINSDSYVRMVANNQFNGAIGNTITITPDGVKTLNTLVNEHNIKEPGNMVTITDGDKSIVPDTVDGDGNSFVFKFSGGVNRDDSTTTVAFTAAEGHTIRGLRYDNNNDLFIHHGDTITKTNYNRLVLHKTTLQDLDSDLTNFTYTQSKFDLVTEFDQDGNFSTDVILILRETDSTPEVRVLRLDSELALKNIETKTLPVDINLNEQKQLTNFETHKQISRETLNKNCLIFKTRYQSYFDTDKTSIKKLMIDVQDLSPGYHHFAVAFNSINSNLSLFVDGVLRSAQTSDDTASGAAYKYTKTIHNPLIVGAEPFFNNILLADHIGIEKYGFYQGFNFRNFYVYNDYLKFNFIKLHSSTNKNIEPLKITLPAGKRNYLDHVTNFYKHRKPGKKASVYDITIVNESLTGTDLHQYINNQLIDKLNNISPINSNVRSVNWIS